MANAPAIILADEPTGALDSKTGRLVMDLFHKLNKEKISMENELNRLKQDNTKKAVIVSYAKIYYDEHRNSLPTSGCIELANLPLSESEMLDSNGDPFEGKVAYQNGSNFEYKDTCP